jgi:hypothetical protein
MQLCGLLSKRGTLTSVSAGERERERDTKGSITGETRKEGWRDTALSAAASAATARRSAASTAACNLSVSAANIAAAAAAVAAAVAVAGS